MHTKWLQELTPFLKGWGEGPGRGGDLPPAGYFLSKKEMGRGGGRTVEDRRGIHLENVEHHPLPKYLRQDLGFVVCGSGVRVEGWEYGVWGLRCIV